MKDYDHQTPPPIPRTVMQILLPIILICFGVAAFWFLFFQKDEIKRKPPAQRAVAVEVMTLAPGEWTSTIAAMGTVAPDRQVMVNAKVGGEVVSISKGFVEGGKVQKGQVLLTIDPLDYQIELEKAQSALDKALADLAIEQGSQQIAKEELRLINEVASEAVEATDLALRKPQLLQAQASVKTARANFEKAKLNLTRTKVVAPFNALVVNKNIELGTVVNASQVLGTLVSIDAYQVTAQVPPDKLWAFEAGEKNGSQAKIHSRYSQQTWDARVVRITGSIGEKTRMAGVILKVSDPLGLKQADSGKPLLLSDHVDIRIMGKVYPNVFVLPRNLLHEGDRIWVYQDGKLEIRKVDVIWKENGNVLIQSGLSPSDQVITSDISAPVKGMTLQIISGKGS